MRFVQNVILDKKKTVNDLCESLSNFYAQQYIAWQKYNLLLIARLNRN